MSKKPSKKSLKPKKARVNPDPVAQTTDGLRALIDRFHPLSSRRVR